MSHPISRQHQLLLLAAVMLAMLFAGLNPRAYRFSNQATWLESGTGITFSPYATAFTEPFLTQELARRFANDGFSLELALSGLANPQRKFALITHLYAGEDQAQLVLGQWKNVLIMMNGDDYENRFQTSRIGMRLPDDIEGDHIVTITSGKGGTRMYLDGTMRTSQPDLKLSMPASPGNGRLIVGNSVHGTRPWHGTIHGLALYPETLDEQTLQRHHQQWRKTGHFSFAQSETPFTLYTFDEQEGATAHDRSVHHNHLLLPKRDVIVKKQFLQAQLHKVRIRWSFLVDVGLNLLGFIPFGLLLSSILHQLGIRGRQRLVMVTTAAVLFSFSIEWVQVWLPSRTSSSLDLVLNGLGGTLGALTFERFTSAWNTRNPGRSGKR